MRAGAVQLALERFIGRSPNIFVESLQSEDREKTSALGYVSDLSRPQTRGIQSSHARTRKAIYRDALLFEPLEHSDVHKTQHAAAFKGQHRCSCDSVVLLRGTRMCSFQCVFH